MSIALIVLILFVAAIIWLFKIDDHGDFLGAIFLLFVASVISFLITMLQPITAYSRNYIPCVTTKTPNGLTIVEYKNSNDELCSQEFKEALYYIAKTNTIKVIEIKHKNVYRCDIEPSYIVSIEDEDNALTQPSQPQSTLPISE